MDVLTKEQRHKAMSHIRSKDTSIEVKLRKALWHKGYRYRKNYKMLPGSPDIVLTNPRIRRGVNADFWEKKILRNMERDDEINKSLMFLGWTVIRFWGCDIKRDVNECIKVIEECIFDNMVSKDVFIECENEGIDSR